MVCDYTNQTQKLKCKSNDELYSFATVSEDRAAAIDRAGQLTPTGVKVMIDGEVRRLLGGLTN